MERYGDQADSSLSTESATPRRLRMRIGLAWVMLDRTRARCRGAVSQELGERQLYRLRTPADQVGQSVWAAPAARGRSAEAPIA